MSSLKSRMSKVKNNNSDEILKFKHVSQRRKEIKEPLSQKVYFLYG